MHNPYSERTITANSISISYFDEGPKDAPVILFIHGYPLTKSMWKNQVELLKKDYRVLAYDVRGHGNTSEGPVDFSIELFVDDLIGFMDSLKIEKAMLCGFSMGGYIALNAIENYPNRFNALVLCDTSCMADTVETKEKRKKTIETIQESGVEKYADELLKALFAPASFSNRLAELAEVKVMIINTSVQSLIRTLNAFARRKETCSRLSEIQVPVLIAVGKEDTITPPSASEQMKSQINSPQIVILDHAGHLSNMENPDEFNKHLKKFVAMVFEKAVI